MLKIGGQEFVETRPLPHSISQGFSEGFGAVITPLDEKLFDFDAWISGDITNIAAYLRKRGAAICKRARIDPKYKNASDWKHWFDVIGSDERTRDTSPHIDDQNWPRLLCLAHKPGDTPRNIATCVSAVFPLAAATKTKALAAVADASESFKAVLKSIIDGNDYHAVWALGVKRATDKQPDTVLVEEYFRFSSAVFAAAAATTFRCDWTSHRDSVLMIDESACPQNREPIVHWKENPPNLGILNTLDSGSVLWKGHFKV